jgi:hypothetical protein
LKREGVPLIDMPEGLEHFNKHWETRCGSRILLCVNMPRRQPKMMEKEQDQK